MSESTHILMKDLQVDSKGSVLRYFFMMCILFVKNYLIKV